MVKWLVGQGAEFCANSSGNTPLHWAIQNKHQEVAQVLLSDNKQLQQKVDVLQQNNSGKSCISFAYDCANEKILKLVLEHPSAEKLVDDDVKATTGEDKVKNAQQSLAGMSVKSGEKKKYSTPISKINGDENDVERADSQDETKADEQTCAGNDQQVVEQLTHQIRLWNGAWNQQGTELLSSDDKLDETVLKITEFALKEDVSGTVPDQHLKATGSILWASSVLFACSLLDLYGEDCRRFDNKSVIELGAGCGLPGITCGRYMNCARVYLTELRNQHTELAFQNLEKNVAENQCPVAKRTSVVSLDWFDEKDYAKLRASNHGKKFDVVLGSDLVYDIKLVAPLLNCVLSLLDKENGAFYYVSAERNRAGVKDFIDALRQAGMNVTQKSIDPSHVRNMKSCFLGATSKGMFDIHFAELESESFVLYTVTF